MMTMTDNTAHIDAIAALACEQLPDADGGALKDFARLYFAQLETKSYADADTAALADMLADHFRLLQEYDGRNARIRISTPTHGRYSVVETVIRDRPFLIDTLTMGIEESGVTVHTLLHAIVQVQRDADGAIARVGAVEDSDGKHLSVVHVRIDTRDEAEMRALAESLQRKIALLDVVVNDWAAMRERLQAVREEVVAAHVPEAPYSRAAVGDFLGWVGNNHFTFLGYREYRVANGDGLIAVGGSGLGLLRNDGEPDQPSQSFQELPPQLRAMVLAPQTVLLSKSSRISPVHRHAYMDFLGIQRFDAQGKVIGEHRFLGLFTRDAYRLGIDDIPLLREKAQQVLARTRLPREGYAWKKLRYILDDFPRDDLFQADIDALTPMVTGILRLQDKTRLRLFARIDAYQRFVSSLVYVPRDRFNTRLREKIQQTLQEAFGGYDSEFSVQFEMNHVRLHVHVRTKAGALPDVDVAALEARLGALMRDWVDEYSEHARNQLPLLRFNHRFPAAYREDHTPWQGRQDAEVMAGLSESSPLDIRLDADHRAGRQSLCFNLYGYQREEHFVAIMDILDRLGMPVKNVRFYTLADGYWIQRYEIDPEKTRYRFSDEIEFQEEYHALIGEAFWRVWMGEVENDRLNQLVLELDREVRDVLVLRALGKYMVQAGVPFSYDYIQQTLLANPVIAEALLSFFHHRMMPDDTDAAARHDMIAAYERRILNLLQDVKSLDEDRIIRWYLDLVKAMLRTNFYQREADGYFKNRLSFKFAASEIPELPKPKPMFEIYVYSPKVEAVHLRGGKVARGGLRWSDRMEDFRTEVLGLVKAQMVKNAVIVPLGSKGGFVVKQPPAEREAWLAEGKECYRTFIRGLLDVTDNLVDGKVVPPLDTVRHDGDDPYLVVAADKGTASFSDIANAISAEYGFWLGDAFASGGSAGYDHKGMGITARGAWESVKRHFRLLGKDIQNKDEFSVVGIGDMSGDVFGNGMLLSKNTLLKAAFNHLHIFIDPNPDAAKSFAERERLFNMPRSTWADYRADLISQGGGVFSRQDKSIAISPEMKQTFAIAEDALTPTELINRLLKAPVDLIWNGGIGTYVKHSEETHAQVGDRANDALRVNGNEIRAKIIGEGGNLGMTQRGRIEAALNGVRLYTDAIDNSGGVNCSDHEVNIKILLNQAIESGELDLAARNELLASMTDSVAEHVLRQNYLQPQIIEIVAAQPEAIHEYARIMRRLEEEGRLDRAIEFLPDDAAIAERAAQGKGLTNPELAILLAYSKMWVYDQLLASDLPDNPYYARELAQYFPEALRETYAAHMQNHRLKRDIIATFLTNDLVNRMGPGYLFRATEESGDSVAQLSHCYVIVREVFAAAEYWQALEALDNRVPATLQIELEIRLRTLLERAGYWFLRNIGEGEELQAVIRRFRTQLEPLLGANGIIAKRFAERYRQERDTWQQQGLPQTLADAFAVLPMYTMALDVALLAEQNGQAAAEIAARYFDLQERLNGHWLLAQINALPAADSWDRRARNALLASFYATLRGITQQLLQNDRSVQDWADDKAGALAKADQAMAELQNRDTGLATLSVVLGEIAALAG